MLNLTKDNTDSVVYSVIQKLKNRASVSLKKYDKTLDKEDLSFLQLLNNTQEELMDAVLSIEKVKKLINEEIDIHEDYLIYGKELDVQPKDVFYYMFLGLSICSLFVYNFPSDN